jgi:nickel-dependent lactate racemase
MEPIALPWGRKDELHLRVPAKWRVVTESDVCPPEPIQDLPAVVRNGFEEPIGCAPLFELIGPDTRVALVMDDIGRPTPVGRLAEIVLDLLIEAGARPEKVTGLFAVGAHRTMDDEEMAARAGAAVASQIACYSFDCRDEAAFVELGRTQQGTPVRLNKTAVQADLRILVGTIEPHPQAGFGGGFKNLLPGLAGAATIGHNHLLMPSAERYNMIGTLPDENPMRLDLEEAGRMIAGPTFIVNVVLDHQLEPVAVVCGDAVAAHRAGVAISRDIYGVRMPQQVDVVISSAYPMGQELRQAGKGILNVAGACRPGGVIVGFMRCEEGLGDVALPRLPLPLALARRLVRAVGSRGIASLVRRIPGPAPEDRFMINFGLQMLKDFHVLIFSPCLKRAYQDRFPPVLYDDQGQLFEAVGQLVGTGAPKVAVFHQGGVSFPIVAW